MKVFTTILKILAALAAIVGIVYVMATYGERIVAWAKKMLGRFGCCCCDCDCDCDCGEAEEAALAEETGEEVTVQDFEG